MKLSLKVMINKDKTKVLIAEADHHFVDVLLSFLTLPLGKIVRIFQKHYGDKAPTFGSITTLYNGLASLDDFHFSTQGAKLMLLNPRSSSESECLKLKVDVADSQPRKYFICDAHLCFYDIYNNVSMDNGISRCDCGGALNKLATMSYSEASVQGADDGVFLKNRVSFSISDDLRMVPNAKGIVQAINNLGVEDIDGAELRTVAFGFNEVIDLLMGSLFSPTPLSDVVLNNKHVGAKSKPAVLLHQIKKEPLPQIKKEHSSSSKIIIKLSVQKSTNKFLFAQAGDDFIDFLCSFLVINLGGVESLLDSKTCLNNIDNLYRSLANVNDDKYFQTQDTKNKLLEPKLPHGYMSENQLLPLSEESAPVLYYKEGSRKKAGTFSHNYIWHSQRVPSFKSPKGQQNYIKDATTYILTDDLTVMPLCMTTSLSMLARLNVPLSDVEELDVRIGLDEALSILKSSLTTTTALTSGLISHVMKKQPKEEA